MPDDLHHQRHQTVTRADNRAAIPTLVLGISLFAGIAPAMAGPKGAFLLIDGGAPAGQSRLTGCDKATSDLHAALDQAGADNTVLIAPTADSLRDGLLRFGNSNGGKPNAVLFCGYAAETGGNIFALGSDFASHDDPALSAVSVRAFSRVIGTGGLVMLDLHPMAADGASQAAVAGALDGAAGAWSNDAGLAGTKMVATDRQPGDASLIASAALHAGNGGPDTMVRAMSAEIAAPAAAPTPAPAPAPAPNPAPGSTQAAPVSSPPVATALAPPFSPATRAPALDKGPAAVAGNGTDQPASPSAAAPASAATTATDASDGTIPLTPKPVAIATGPRVHVDPAVRSVQVALLARGLFNGRVNGVNSPDTQNGIRHFQAMLGHPTTGQLTADETKQLTGE